MIRWEFGRVMIGRLVEEEAGGCGGVWGEEFVGEERWCRWERDFEWEWCLGGRVRKL